MIIFTLFCQSKSELRKESPLRIEALKLINFRNYPELELELDKNLNLFVGANGQGKTNLLEAISFLASGVSFRTHNESELVFWGEKNCFVSGIVSKRFGKQTQQVFYESEKRKKTFKNQGVLIERRKYLSQLIPVLFIPEDLTLVKGQPQGRRRFLDEEIVKVSPVYEFELGRYQQIVRQRNFLLKKYREKIIGSQEMESWNEQLVTQAVKILTKRMAALRRISLLARLVHRNLTGRRENLEINYASLPTYQEGAHPEQIRQSLLESMEERKQEEVRWGQTLVGPHRDDILFFINGKNAKMYASQGQQRTLVLALKLAELEYVKGETGEYPVLLFDDVFSELDENRRRFLVETIEGRVQTFITGTEAERLGNFKHSGRMFTVSRGEVL
ncbi:MAG: DNA replication/repair protein RecF [Dethiobacter sp.]|jgi:DNA replication and repair protein RecF|nr:DNA replication/repair protein RecF [Dethiobacter sp.]